MRASSPIAPFGSLAAVALLAGIGACLVLPQLPPWPWLAAAFAGGMGIWVRGARLWLAGPVLLGVGLAGLHAAATLQQQVPRALEGAEVEVIGRVVDLPQVEARRTRFRLRVEGGSERVLRGALLQLGWYDDYGSTTPGPRVRLHAGESWRMRVKLRAPRGLRNPGGFDVERHALAQRIVAQGHVRDPGNARRIAAGRGIDAWRERMSRRIARTVESTSARFVRALALGDTGGLDDPDWSVLRANGLTHLIAISGFHVGLAAGFFALFARGIWWLWPPLARRLPRSQAAGLAAVGGGLVYAAVAGFALPTVRTVLMIVVVVAARLWRRQQRASESLALAAMSMLLVDPLAALAPGFWLSFAGVAWLLWCLPNGNMHPLREFLGAQGVAALALLPLTVALFGQASLAGPLANLVAVPWWSLVVVPLALLGTGLESLVAGSGAWPWQAAAAAFDLSWPLFEALARSRFSLWWLAEARWFALPLALTGAFWLLLPRGVPGKSLALLLWLPLSWPSRQLPQPGDAEIVMIDVGQGLSVLVRTARHALLYDMGPAIPDGFDAGERAVLPALRALGVRRLDLAVVSHGDNDHAGGLQAVRDAIPIRELVGAQGDPLPETRDCVAGQQWQWDGVRIRVLHPSAHFPYLGNESSCVLRIETRHGAALLTGDIGEVIEQRLLREAAGDLQADVVTVAHHGSRHSSDPGFVQATAARVALVSAGHGNRFGHPNAAVAARWKEAGAALAVSADTGAVRIMLGESMLGESMLGEGMLGEGMLGEGMRGGRGMAVTERRRSHPRLWDAVRRGLSYRPD